MADYRKALDLITTMLRDGKAFLNGRPQFRTPEEMHQFLTGKGFTLVRNEAFGPESPEARHLIYEGPHNVIVKVKTQGYAQGRRAGQATMSIEVTDGKGNAWGNTLFKVDGRGRIIAKNYVDVGELAKLPDGSWGVKRGSTGKVEPIVSWEVVQGGRGKPINKDAWADSGHLDFGKEFKPDGAKDLAVRNVPKAQATATAGVSAGAKATGGVRARATVTPIGIAARNAKIKAVGRFAGMTFAAAGVFALLAYSRAKFDERFIRKQIEDLEPDIDAELQKRRQQVIELIEAGKQPYANISIQVATVTTVENEAGFRMPFTTLPVVTLKSVNVSDRDISGPGPTSSERLMGGVGGTVNKQIYNFSFEVGL